MKPKHISREKYIETFCRDIRMHDRQVLYVSAKTHAKIRDITHLFREYHITTTSHRCNSEPSHRDLQVHIRGAKNGKA